jgi:hypothetical protein
MALGRARVPARGNDRLKRGRGHRRTMPGRLFDGGNAVVVAVDHGLYNGRANVSRR